MLLFLFACLPCSVKQELKIELQAPVSQQSVLDKSVQIRNCSVITANKIENQKQLVLSKFLPKTSYFKSFVNQISTKKLVRFSSDTHLRGPTVPVYIQHQQFLL